jgi:hypothetical protein
MTTIPGGVTAPPGGTITAHLGTGATTATDAYLGLPAADLSGKLTSGTPVVLFTDQGVPASIFTVP